MVLILDNLSLGTRHMYDLPSHNNNNNLPALPLLLVSLLQQWSLELSICAVVSANLLFLPVPDTISGMCIIYFQHMECWGEVILAKALAVAQVAIQPNHCLGAVILEFSFSLHHHNDNDYEQWLFQWLKVYCDSGDQLKVVAHGLGIRGLHLTYEFPF